MKLSIVNGSKHYNAVALAAIHQVFLNGKLRTDIIEFDSDEGWVLSLQGPKEHGEVRYVFMSGWDHQMLLDFKAEGADHSITEGMYGTGN